MRFTNNQLKDFKIVDICKLKQGNQYDLKQQFTEEKSDLKRFIRIVDYTQKTNDIRYVYSNGSENYVDCTDVVVVRYGASAGYVGRGINGIIANNLFTIRPINSALLNKSYLYHYLNAPVIQKQLNNTQSSGMPALNFQTINNLHILLPEYQEQHQIAVFLDKIDERIQTQIKIIDDLLTVKNGISNKLFKLQQIELSNHYLFEYLIEGDKTAVDTSCYKKITVKLNNQGLAFSELNREMADTRPFYVRHKGELIIGKQNYFNGSIAIVTEQFDNCICSNAIMSFKIKGIYSDFLYYQISNNNYLNSQSYKANGTGQKELSEKEFLNFKIWCPQLEVQQKIVNCFKSLDLKIENEKAILNSYFQEKSYLLNNMFI